MFLLIHPIHPMFILFLRFIYFNFVYLLILSVLSNLSVVCVHYWSNLLSCISSYHYWSNLLYPFFFIRCSDLFPFIDYCAFSYVPSFKYLTLMHFLSYILAYLSIVLCFNVIICFLFPFFDINCIYVFSYIPFYWSISQWLFLFIYCLMFIIIRSTPNLVAI